MDANTTPAGAVDAIMSIAKQKGISFTQAARTHEGRYIMNLVKQLPPEPETVSKQRTGEPPGYLQAAAEAIARRDGISTEVAYAKIRRERPDLAERYEAETT